MPLVAYADTPRALRLFPARSLHRLVREHAGACEVNGLNVDDIDGEEDSTVHDWLIDRAGRLPLALADDLDRIQDLADERGANALIDAARRYGVDAGSLGMDPFEVAVRVFLDHRQLFENTHGRQIVETLRGTTEYMGKCAASVGPVADQDVNALEARLGRQFDARARSAHCRVTVGRDGDCHVFTIAHGALVRADEALDERPMLVSDSKVPVYLTDRAVRYRPQRRDIVVYEAAAGRLRIRAGDAPTLHAYRKAFGELLFGDAEWFGSGPVVSLEPLLRLGRGVEAPTPGVREVRLVGLKLRFAEPIGKQALSAEEMWSFLAAHVVGGLAGAEVLEATFRLFPTGSSSVANVKVRAPNRVEYSRAEDDIVRPFLEQRGFLARAAGRVSA